MASGLSKALEGFALGTLGQAAGQDFLGPALAHERSKDLFAFQQREAMRLREEARTKDREERKASRRGLVEAFQAVGAVRPEDIVAAGGLDAISELEDDEFQLLTTRLSDQQFERLRDEDLFAAVRGMAAATGRPIPEGQMTRSQAIQLKAEMDMDTLMREERKQDRAEAARAVDMTLRQGSRDILGLFRNPQAVSNDTLVQAFGRHQQLAARVRSAAGELDDAQYEAAIGELNYLAETIRAYQDDAALNSLAAQPPAQIVSALTKLEPHQREAALARPRVHAAWSRVEAAAQALVGLGEAGAEKVGLGTLREAALNGDIEADADLAGRLYANAGKVAEAPRLLKEAEIKEAGEAEAEVLGRRVASSGFAKAVDPKDFVDDRGRVDEEGFLRAAYADAVQGADDLDPAAALNLLTELSVAGAPSDMQRMAAKQAQRAMDRKVSEVRPDELSPVDNLHTEVQVQEDVAYESLDEVLAAPIETTPFKASTGRIVKDTAIDIATFTLSRPFRTSFHEEPDVVAPEHLAKLREAVQQTALPLEGQLEGVREWGRRLKEEGEAYKRSGETELSAMFDLSKAEAAELAAVVQRRLTARNGAVSMLKAAAPSLSQFQMSAGGTDPAVAESVLRAFGKTEGEASEGAASLDSPEAVFGTLKEALVTQLRAEGHSSADAGQAAAAEMDRLIELYLRLDAHLQRDDNLKRYRAAGIVRGQAADLPALELLAYLL